MTKEQALEILKNPSGKKPAELKEAMSVILANTIKIPD